MDPNGANPSQPKPPSLLTAKQVADRMQDRACMRLDRDPVPRTQHIEKECRQKRNHRGAGCLMAADFEAITVLAQVICVVDDPTRQPEDLALQLGKQLQPVLFRCRGRLRPILRCLSHAVRSCTATMTSMIAVWRNDGQRLERSDEAQPVALAGTGSR